MWENIHPTTQFVISAATQEVPASGKELAITGYPHLQACRDGRYRMACLIARQSVFSEI